MTLYSMGLRLSEGLNLTIHDIDKSTMLVNVRDGKGGKDRMVHLPDHTLLALRDYWKTHRHARLIFPGSHVNAKTHMNKGGVQKSLK
jgi:site-specific recombinase XerD